MKKKVENIKHDNGHDEHSFLDHKKIPAKDKLSLPKCREFIETHIPVKNKFNEQVLAEALDQFRYLENFAPKHVHTSSNASGRDDLAEASDLLSRLGAMISVYYFDTSSYENSRDFALKKLEIDKASNNYTGVAKSYTILGNIFTDLGDFEQAIDFHLKALKIAKSISNQDEIGVTYTNLGNIEVHKKNYDEAFKYYMKANEILSGYDRLKIQLATNLHNIGIVYFYKEEYDKSYEYYQKSKELRKDIEDKRGEAQTISNIALLLEKKGDEEGALSELNKAIKTQKEINDRTGLFYTSLMKANLIFRMGNKEDSLSLMNEITELAAEIRSDILTSMVFEYKYEIFSSLGNYEEALINYEKYYELNKKITNQKKERKTSNLLLLYELEEAKVEAEINDKIFNNLTKAVEDLSVSNKRLTELQLEKNEILNVAAHDLRNPVSNIKILSEFIQKKEASSPEEEAEFYKMILKSADNMLSMISDLLNINLLEKTNYTVKNDRFCAAELIRDLVDIYKLKAETKNIKIELNTQKDIGLLMADRVKLGQVLDNLLSNAIKFSPPGKTVTIDVKEKNKKCIISVRDEGPGFSEHDLKNAFNKFTKLSARPTAGEDSTGLGLFIVKKLIEMLNGSIIIKTTQNEGAEMTIELPAP